MLNIVHGLVEEYFIGLLRILGDRCFVLLVNARRKKSDAENGQERPFRKMLTKNHIV
jgi:hypothetical protein